MRCAESRCTLLEKCQRYDTEGTHKPTLPFFPGGDMPDDWEAYNGPLSGCPDFWPADTGFEHFLNSNSKTPTT